MSGVGVAVEGQHRPGLGVPAVSRDGPLSAVRLQDIFVVVAEFVGFLFFPACFTEVFIDGFITPRRRIGMQGVFQLDTELAAGSEPVHDRSVGSVVERHHGIRVTRQRSVDVLCEQCRVVAVPERREVGRDSGSRLVWDYRGQPCRPPVTATGQLCAQRGPHAAGDLPQVPAVPVGVVGVAVAAQIGWIDRDLFVDKGNQQPTGQSGLVEVGHVVQARIVAIVGDDGPDRYLE